jgi:hypothetical protein
VRRVELHLGVAPSHYEPGEKREGEPGATTGAGSAPATGGGDGEREALKL